MLAPNPTVSLLTAARNLISDPNHWCQGAYARTVYGNPVGPAESSAVTWCAFGALNYLAADEDGIALQKAEVALTVACDGNAVFINDLVGHEAILAKFDEAIATSLVFA